ncbi:MAG: SDR family oxidoreductase [Candidatus Micrarchaeaceae archaeon]|jgi:uncharacterized oxidoreductase
MNTRNNTVLITGGATGIGFALAESFLKLGNKVIICGRREDKLKEAEQKCPDLYTIRCDLSSKKECELLYQHIALKFENLNILVNNAGIQKRVDFTKGARDFDDEDEIDINLKAPIYLSSYFVPLLSKHKESAIINVSSGLGFVPLSFVPVYSATKAAIHSFTISLRHQLKSTSIKVFEVIPPTVDTDLDRGRRPQRTGIQASEVADAALKGLESNVYEITVGASVNLRNSTPADFDNYFNNMNP